MVGGQHVCPDHNFVILSQNDLELGIHVHFQGQDHNLRSNVIKQLVRSITLALIAGI